MQQNLCFTVESPYGNSIAISNPPSYNEAILGTLYNSFEDLYDVYYKNNGILPTPIYNNQCSICNNIHIGKCLLLNKCNKCVNADHDGINCPNRKVCIICNKYGHLASTCKFAINNKINKCENSISSKLSTQTLKYYEEYKPINNTLGKKRKRENPISSRSSTRTLKCDEVSNSSESSTQTLKYYEKYKPKRNKKRENPSSSRSFIQTVKYYEEYKPRKSIYDEI